MNRKQAPKDNDDEWESGESVICSIEGMNEWTFDTLQESSGGEDVGNKVKEELGEE